jgi:hypothetical protein
MMQGVETTSHLHLAEVEGGRVEIGRRDFLHEVKAAKAVLSVYSTKKSVHVPKCD